MQAAAPLPCSYTLSSGSASVGHPNSLLNFSVSAPAGCLWNAVSNATWVAVSSGAAGSGNGTVTLTVAENTNTSPRAASVSVGGQTFTVQQAAAPAPPPPPTPEPPPCEYAVTPVSTNVNHDGGPAAATVITASGCSWTATSNSAWISISSGTNGSGSGSVSIQVAANPSQQSRTGSVSIAGRTLTIQQNGAPVVVACSYSLNATSFPMGHQTGSLVVQVTTGNTCSWSAASNVPWISVSSPASNAGSGTATLQVQGNSSGSSRTGTLLIAGQTVSVSQSALPTLPTVSLSPSQVVLSAQEDATAPATASVLATANQTGLPISVGQSTPSWLSVSASAGVTPATISLSANPAGLAPGSYTATVPVLSTGSANPQLSISITFNVESAVIVRASPRSLSFSSFDGKVTNLTQTIRVKVSGSSTPVRAYVEGGTWLSATAEFSRGLWAVQTTVDPRGLQPGIYDASVGLGCATAECRTQLIPVRLQVLAASSADSGSPSSRKALISSGGIVNAASFQQGIAEGAWMSIFGQDLASEVREWRIEDFDGPRFPRSIGGVQVKVDGKPAAIHFVSPGQINFQAPSGIAKGWVSVEITTPFGGAQAYTFSSKESPGFFQIDADGQVAALFGDGRAVGRLPENASTGGKWTPAQPGSTIAIYGTGFGPTDPDVEAGAIYQGAAQLIAKGAAKVLIGGKDAKVEFVGLSGAGLNQLNVTVPALPRGDDHPRHHPLALPPDPSATGEITPLFANRQYRQESRCLWISQRLFLPLCPVPD
ncbi:MAG: BACON domain-containing carbohydrate-binding protein [Bryobacterales bacterium]|nr:BACON domain-containing carbohydrate-binding protein [Bryobacterales bacterium]